MFSIFLSFENPGDYEIRCKNIVESDRLQATTWRVHIARWLPKAKNTHLEYVTLFSIATMFAQTRLSVTLYMH